MSKLPFKKRLHQLKFKQAIYVANTNSAGDRGQLERFFSIIMLIDSNDGT